MISSLLLSLITFRILYSMTINEEDRGRHTIALTSDHVGVIEAFFKVKVIFSEEIHISFEHKSCGLRRLCNNILVHYGPIPKVRECLVQPPLLPERPTKVFNGTFEVDQMLNFVNECTESFRIIDGSISYLGTFLHRLTKSQYRVARNEECAIEDATMLNFTSLLNQYILPQRPVVIRGLGVPFENPLSVLESFYYQEVGVKLSTSESFEGIEAIDEWGGINAQYIPPDILRQLQSPDKVVVRAAHKDMRLGEFMQLLHRNQRGSLHQSLNTSMLPGNCPFSAYVEYLDLSYHLYELQQKLLERFDAWNNSLPFPIPLLEGKPYMWLGDGRTVGRLHFDPFDNILVQLEGSKTFYLVDPSDNVGMLEGHMREAQLVLDSDASQPDCPAIKRGPLLESTSMVHSPVPLHFEHDSEVKAADSPVVLRCTVRRGDIIFVPSFWWHEVASSPGSPGVACKGASWGESCALPHPQINLAVNIWFEPVFKKEFPCKRCRKRFNFKYVPVLQELLSAGFLGID